MFERMLALALSVLALAVVLQAAELDTILPEGFECPAGYAFDGQDCTDVDECAQEDEMRTMVCYAYSTCQNTMGSYTCECNEGYVKNGELCKLASVEYDYKEGTGANTTNGDRQLLYLWYSDNDEKQADFLATLDFDRDSINYGAVVSISPLLGDFRLGNEAHHIGISADHTTLLAGGLFAYRAGHPDLFLFDIGTDAARPRYSGWVDSALSSAADEFVTLPDGHLMVTMMGGAHGGPQGRLLELDENNEVVAEWPEDIPKDFSPHGISIRPEHNLMATADYVVPESLFDGPMDLPKTIQIWDLGKREIIRTVSIPDSESLMDVVFIPGDPFDRAYAPGQNGMLYVIHTRNGTVTPVYDFNPLLLRGEAAKNPAGTQPHLLRINKDGTRLFQTFYAGGKVTMLDTTDPERPRILKIIDLGAKAGPHFLSLSHDEKRLVVTTTFIENTYQGGTYRFGGTMRTYVFLISDDDMVHDPLWYHSGEHFRTGPARPHGAVIFNS